jgi:hypothetical protein
METCKVIITRGKNTGQPCGHKIVDNERCKSHQIRSEAQQGCEFILTRGESKGEKCNRPIKNGSFCYSHSTDLNFVECAVIITRGSRKGQACGRRCKAPDTICTVHRTKPELSEQVSVTVLDSSSSGVQYCTQIVQAIVEPVFETVEIINEPTHTMIFDEPGIVQDESIPNPDPLCQVILTRGPKKGEKCMKRSCAVHRPKRKIEILSSNDLPTQESIISVHYSTHQAPGVSYNNSVVLFTQKGDIHFEPNFEAKYIIDTKNVTKINDRLTIKFEKNKFTLNNRTGDYYLKDILDALYYVYNTCTQAKHTVKITQVTLHSDGRLTDNARYVSTLN